MESPCEYGIGPPGSISHGVSMGLVLIQQNDDSDSYILAAVIPVFIKNGALNKHRGHTDYLIVHLCLVTRGYEDSSIG